MLAVMYDAVPDPYCYPGTTVLKNKLGIADQAQLEAFEAEITAQRSAEPLPAGDLSFTHYLAIHRHLFQDVYSWAGELRTVRISKGGSMFCYPENLRAEMEKLFATLKEHQFFQGADAGEFARKAGHFLAELNAIHPFREGNGRTQLTFFLLLAARAGHDLDLDRLDPAAAMAAIIASFDGDEHPLVDMIAELLE
jgi:cell filamentation protein